MVGAANVSQGPSLTAPRYTKVINRRRAYSVNASLERWSDKAASTLRPKLSLEVQHLPPMAAGSRPTTDLGQLLQLDEESDPAMRIARPAPAAGVAAGHNYWRWFD